MYIQCEKNNHLYNHFTPWEQLKQAKKRISI